MIGAISERNYPLVQASILLATLSFVLVNALVDLLYARPPGPGIIAVTG